MNSGKIFHLPMLAVVLSVCSPVLAEEQVAVFSQAELDQMLAPIALYPDVLLSQVLMAATYPLDVVEAGRWSRDNPGLSGQEAVEAVQDMNWDISVKELVAFPELIQLMDDNLSWTRELGEAFLLQEDQVLQTAQNLRRRSMDEGTLQGLEHVVVEQQDEVIIIEPADVEVVYVPYYQPHYVYGRWWWSDYPPYYWNPPIGYWGGVSFYWGLGFHISSGFYFSSCDWNRHRVVIHNHPRLPRHYYSRTPDRRSHHYDPPVNWQHNPDHRRGVRYRSPELSERYSHKRTLQATSRNPDSPGSRILGSTSDRRDHARIDTPDRTRRTDQSTRPSRGDRLERRDGNRLPDGRTASRNTNRITVDQRDNKPAATTRTERMTRAQPLERASSTRITRTTTMPPAPRPAIARRSDRQTRPISTTRQARPNPTTRPEPATRQARPRPSVDQASPKPTARSQTTRTAKIEPKPRYSPPPAVQSSNKDSNSNSGNSYRSRSGNSNRSSGISRSSSSSPRTRDRHEGSPR